MQEAGHSIRAKMEFVAGFLFCQSAEPRSTKILELIEPRQIGKAKARRSGGCLFRRLGVARVCRRLPTASFRLAGGSRRLRRAWA
jgi:hypothetical protein